METANQENSGYSRFRFRYPTSSLINFVSRVHEINLHACLTQFTCPFARGLLAHRAKIEDLQVLGLELLAYARQHGLQDGPLPLQLPFRVEDCIMRYDVAKAYISHTNPSDRYLNWSQEITGIFLCDHTRAREQTNRLPAPRGRVMA